MFCKNCKQDIGNRNECPHCGFNPTLDAEGAAPYTPTVQALPQPVRIVLNQAHNGKANSALILSFLGFLIVPGIISFFFALGGLAQAKACRSGKGKSIAALLILLIWTIIFVSIIRALTG